jgi:molybdopterin-containing oxidoreductase family iron-sulfur binding subunit
MYFGDMEDPHSEVSRLAESPRAFRLLEELGTEPKVVYLSKGEWGAGA